uniref:Uncharacterized protein n=1 Tax=Helianthus annuus TaxID=4232 RepID=A0A251S485_HELAN
MNWEKSEILERAQERQADKRVANHVKKGYFEGGSYGRRSSNVEEPNTIFLKLPQYFNLW